MVSVFSLVSIYQILVLSAQILVGPVHSPGGLYLLL